jgi:translation initiation factor eIF-2B subunit epsilon
VLMTTVYKRATPTHASRSLEDDTVVGLSKEDEILFWENSPESAAVEIDPMLILGEAKGSMQLRYDLLDTQVDVCSVEVLQLFKDNFDYQTLRSDFMTGVLGDDITDHRLFAHIIHEEYAARVKDLHTYASVSQDVVHRWVSPIVVDNSLLDPKSGYRLTRNLVYRDRNVRTHLNCTVGPDVVLGVGCSIGEGSVVAKTVVGRNCVIGKNCRIVNCFLWAGVEVEDNCVMEWSLLCNNVKVYMGSVIGKDSILSFGVCVGPNAMVRNHSRLTRNHLEDNTRNVDLGNKGKGFLWVTEEETTNNKLHVSLRHLRKHSLGDDSNDEEEEKLGVSGASARGEEVLSETDESSVDGAAAGTDFDQEVREIVIEGVTSGGKMKQQSVLC